jgi:hypothetical protein
MTSAAVRLLLVEGADGDGVTIDYDEFDVATVRQSAADSLPEHVAAAVAETEAITSSEEHHVRSIGLTWTADAETDAALLLEVLAEAGIHNVVAVPADEAARKLAAGIASLVDLSAVAVCIVEPGMVLSAKIRGGFVDDIDTAVNPGDPRAVARWVAASLATPGWRPNRIVVVGSAGNLKDVVAELKPATNVPVVSAAEAELALARGAALVSARSGLSRDDSWVLADDDLLAASEIEPRIARLAAMREPLWPESRREDDAAKPGMPRKVRALAGVFIAAVLTFVISLSAAVGLQLTPQRKTSTAAPREMASASAEPAMVPHAIPPGPAVAPAPPEALPAQPAAEPVGVVPPESAPLIDVPDAAQMVVPEALPPAPPEGAPDLDAPEGAPDAPPPAFMPPAPAYTEPLPPKHPILSRIPIINRIPGVRGPATPPQVQQDPGVLSPGQ